MAKVAKVGVVAAPVAEVPVRGAAHLLSEARQKELASKIAEATEYYGRAFNVDLSPKEIHQILLKVIERDKERLFLSKIGTISEADILWYADLVGIGGGVNGKQGKAVASESATGEASSGAGDRDKEVVFD